MKSHVPSSFSCTQHGISPESETKPPGRFQMLINKTKHLAAPTPGLGIFFHHVNCRPGDAIDLGAGGGRDSRALKNNGWKVIAIDTSAHVRDALSDVEGESLRVHHGTLQSAKMESETVDLVNAQRVLPFIHGDALDATLAEAANVLRPGGHLCASFFGPAHSWNDGKHPALVFHTKEEIEALLKNAGLQVRTIQSSTNPSRAANGEMVSSWHEINVIAQKKMPMKTGGSRIQKLRDLVELPKKPSVR